MYYDTRLQCAIFENQNEYIFSIIYTWRLYKQLCITCIMSHSCSSTLKVNARSHQKSDWNVVNSKIMCLDWICA